MTNNAEQRINPVTVLVIAIAALMALVGMIGGENKTAPTTDRSDRNYRYVEERMKLEGMSSSEARQAADAVVKFHEAQKARQR